METKPQRSSLIAETAATLKEWIGSSALAGVLPGEMRLKNRLHVSRDTLRMALKILEREGWIAKAAKGEQRRVQVKRRTPVRGSPDDQPVSFLSPYPIVDRITLLEMEVLQRRLSEQRRELRFLSANFSRMKNPETYLKRLVSENPSAAWILHSVSARAQRWFEKNRLPAFIYGTPFPGVELPYIVNDWESAAFHAGGLLLEQSHHVIGLLSFEEEMPGTLAIERGLRRALAGPALQPAPRLLVLKNDRSPRSVAHSLETAFRLVERPTALVLSGSSQLLTCFSWMLFHGLCVPRDVSLICIPSDSWFYDLRPSVCHYENAPGSFALNVARRVLELVQTGRVTSRSLRVRLNYVSGATIGPAPVAPLVRFPNK